MLGHLLTGRAHVLLLGSQLLIDRRAAARRRGERSRRQGASIWRPEKDNTARHRTDLRLTSGGERDRFAKRKTCFRPVHPSERPRASGLDVQISAEEDTWSRIFLFHLCLMLLLSARWYKSRWDRGDRSFLGFGSEMSSDKPVLAPGSALLTDREAPTPAAAGSGQQVVTGSVTGDMMVSGSGAVVLPAGVINPSVPIRNIKMKFAVLIGLIQVGEVSNRDIVETVLNLVSICIECIERMFYLARIRWCHMRIDFLIKYTKARDIPRRNVTLSFVDIPVRFITTSFALGWQNIAHRTSEFISPAYYYTVVAAFICSAKWQCINTPACNNDSPNKGMHLFS